MLDLFSVLQTDISSSYFTLALCIITQLRGDAYHNLSSKSESGWNNCIGGCFIINTFSSVGATASSGIFLRNLKWAPYLSAQQWTCTIYAICCISAISKYCLGPMAFISKGCNLFLLILGRLLGLLLLISVMYSTFFLLVL